MFEKLKIKNKSLKKEARKPRCTSCDRAVAVSKKHGLCISCAFKQGIFYG